jgi:ATP-binding cassette subfamily B protein
MTSEPGVLSELHILVVEDDDNARTILRDLFKYFGASVTVANSARDALRRLRQVNPDVVVADMRLGDRNASWLLRESRDIPCEAPFVAVTAYSFDERALRTQGFVALLKKPLDRDGLVDAVLTAARRR